MTEDPSRQASSTNPTPPDWDAIARFLAGESPADEVARVRRWLDANPVDRELIERLNVVATSEPADVDIETALLRVHMRLDEPSAASRPTVVRGDAAAAAGSRRKIFYFSATVAAAAAAAAVFVTLRSSPEHGAPPAESSAAAPRTYATAIGQRDSIMLGDGSRVILGPDSRLTVPADFGGTTRAVELRGDAYFDVRHDTVKPFAVRVSHAIIEDVGTTFTVESDGGDTTTVAVMSGSVRLRATGSGASAGAVLVAGDRGSLSADGHVHADPHAVTDDSAWTTGRLVFRNASVSRVAGELRRWYGVELRIADTSLLRRTVKMTFNDGDPIDQVLKILGLALGARVERQGETATISPMRGTTTAR